MPRRTTTTTDAAEPIATGPGTDDREINQSLVGVVRGGSVTIDQAAVAGILAQGEVSISKAGAQTIVSAGNLRLEQGGGGRILAGGDVAIQQGGAGTLVSLGGVSIQQGGAVVALARSVEAGEGSFIGLALAPSVTVQPGGRVLAGPREAAIVGAVAGLVIGGIAAAVRNRG